MISTSRQPASVTNMPTVTQSLFNPLPANACLARTRWIYLNQFAPSIFGFVRKKVKELSPSGIVYRFCQHTTSQSRNVQIFNHQQAICQYEPIGKFMVEV